MTQSTPTTRSSRQRLRRNQAAAHVRDEWNLPCSPKTLAKLAVLRPVLTKENIPEWVEKANGMNSESLKAAVRDALDGGKLKTEGALSNVKTKNFKFDDDQLDIVDTALEKAKTVANPQTTRSRWS